MWEESQLGGGGGRGEKPDVGKYRRKPVVFISSSNKYHLDIHCCVINCNYPT